MIVIKRDGSRANFQQEKIYNAIMKAMKYGSGKIDEKIAMEISEDIHKYTKRAPFELIRIQDIERYVFELLCNAGHQDTARAYEGYRAVRKYQRESNTIDEKVLGLIDGSNKSMLEENSNKQASLISTQRDLVAEEVSKDICLRMKLPPHIAQAHMEGLIHVHDLGHYLNPSFNCFSADTKFITNKGTRAFSDCFHGEEVEVIDKHGQWQKAIVKRYSFEPLQKVTLQSGRSTTTVRCTKNHRWVLKNGEVTTTLKEGDVLWLTPNIEKRTLYKNSEMFTLGLIIGDGSDVIKENSKGMTIRLCGEKNKYKDVFEECGYKVTYVHPNGDLQLFRAKRALKQNFIKNHVWEYLDKDSLIDIFNGYYCADGSSDRNMISTSNYDLVEFIKYTSGMCGYYISSITVNNKPTNFSENRTLYEVRFRKKTNPNNAWKVKSIDRADGVQRETWCVEQPINQTFTLAEGIVTGNCCLVNLKDMFENGTVINGKMIETPKSFRTACTIATQIIAQVASGQFGGQTISLAHLSPYVRTSKDKIKRRTIKKWDKLGIKYSQETLNKSVLEDLATEVKDGIQTLQYQVNTLQTSNGQSPFLSIFMWVNEYPEYEEETAMLIDEVLRQRYIGLKNEKGVYITPAFPKLLYALDENNTYEGSKYRYLTELSAKTVAKRMMPDLLSVKVLKENYQGIVTPPMGCRALLSPYFDENGDGVLYGRFNMGITSLNLADIGLTAKKDLEKFWNILDERLELCKESLMLRYEKLKDVTSDVSPIHWQYGAIARLGKHEPIFPLLQNGYATISLGYSGIYECVMALIGQSNTSAEGEELALKIMNRLKKAVVEWKAETGLGFALYGTPQESLTEKFSGACLKRHGYIEGVTGKGYVTNSYHVNVEEEIDAFSKLKYEAQFHSISSGGSVSYIEVANMQNNIPAVLKVIEFMYENIQYAELNTKSDYCQKCGYDGEILINEGLEWYCPNCGNKDKETMNVVRRTCGYLGENYWCEGRTKEIKDRVMHL